MGLHLERRVVGIRGCQPPPSLSHCVYTCTTPGEPIAYLVGALGRHDCWRIDGHLCDGGEVAGGGGIGSGSSGSGGSSASAHTAHFVATVLQERCCNIALLQVALQYCRNVPEILSCIIGVAIILEYCSNIARTWPCNV